MGEIQMCTAKLDPLPKHDRALSVIKTVSHVAWIVRVLKALLTVKVYLSVFLNGLTPTNPILFQRDAVFVLM